MFAYTAVVISLIGTAVSAYSSVAAGQNAKETADYNSEMQRRQAKDVLVRGSIAADEKRQQARKIIGAQTAAMGASGFATDSGSPLQLLTESAGMGELDALRTLNNAQRQASGLNAQADITQWQGNVAETTGAMNAAGTALGGLASAGMGYYNAKGGGTPSNATGQNTVLAPSSTAKGAGGWSYKIG